MTPSTSYHTQHAPLGAFASFTIGRHGARGGFGQSLAGPAHQNVFIGYRPSAEPTWRLLPFFDAGPQRGAEAFTGEAGANVAPSRRALRADEFTRELGWASDIWKSGAFTFGLANPWDRAPDPARGPRAAQRAAFAPCVFGWIEFDNRAGPAPVELVFGIGDAHHPWRPVAETAADLLGFAHTHLFGYATRPGPDVEPRQAFAFEDPKFRDHRGLHLLGPENALVFHVPAGVRRRFPLVLAFYQAGPVTSGLETRFHYTSLFRDLEDVLRHGLATQASRLRVAARRDAVLARSSLSADQRWLVAQATHSYFGSTELLRRASRPLWIVNEGEYRMLNTFDLTVDHLFFELAWFPWAVRDTLVLFRRRYAYRDTLHGPEGRRASGGISFTHDMGVSNHFTPTGRSSYECRDLHGCFSHMAMEQLVNWICCAVTYALHTGDLAWLRREAATLRACARSLSQRDDPDPARRDGLLKWDSDRCGPQGSEITTYDSLDVSLGQARLNLYLQVKALAAWWLIEEALAALGDRDGATRARASADRIVRTLEAKYDPQLAAFPAVFEGGNRSVILPAIEGLVFLLHLGRERALRRRYPTLLARLEEHLRTALQPGVCLDATSGAWKISSTSTNTWFSKIALAQHVARSLFPEALTPAARDGDRVHADFQRGPHLGAHAMVDQFHSATGQPLGSLYYPRGVTSFLWLQERPAPTP
jgi:hypothetical protein